MTSGGLVLCKPRAVAHTSILMNSNGGTSRYERQGCAERLMECEATADVSPSGRQFGDSHRRRRAAPNRPVAD